ncbi:oligosaccharide flippase family protein [Candidatus Gottesmanbacteria bacterium]|nr:oligosaccharide flippase family protein [Candidatus Gottesmanbacteria bacterium]
MRLAPQLSSTRLAIFWNTGSQLVGKFINSGTTFLITILIARSFGVDGFGDFTKITTYIAFFYLLADFGINAVYLQKQETEENLWGVLLGLRLVGSIALVFLSLAILSFLPRGIGQGYTSLVRLGIILFSPAIIVQAVITTANASFQKHLRYDLSTLSLTIGSIISLLCVWVITMVVSPSVGSVFATSGFLIGLVVTSVTSLFFAAKLTALTLSLRWKSMLPLLLSSIPLGLTLLFNQLYFRADTFILTITRSTTEVGLYGLAYKFFELPLAIATFFMNSMYPLLLAQQTQSAKLPSGRLGTGKTQNFQNLIWKSGIFLLLASLILLLLFWFIAPLITLIRPEFTPSVGAFRILILGLPFFFLSSLTMWTLVTLKKHVLLASIYGASMVGTIILDLYAIPRFGYMGAAWITVISEAIVLCVSAGYLWRLFYSMNIDKHQVQNSKSQTNSNVQNLKS